MQTQYNFYQTFLGVLKNPRIYDNNVNVEASLSNILDMDYHCMQLLLIFKCRMF